MASARLFAQRAPTRHSRLNPCPVGRKDRLDAGLQVNIERRMAEEKDQDPQTPQAPTADESAAGESGPSAPAPAGAPKAGATSSRSAGLAESEQAPPAAEAPLAGLNVAPPKTRRLSATQLVLLVNMVLILFAIGCLFYVVATPSKPVEVLSVGPKLAQASPVAITQVIEPEPKPLASTSLREAEAAFLLEDYPRALACYRKLLEVSQVSPAEMLTCDFLRVRVANCLAQLGRNEEAHELFQTLSQSVSPIVRAVSYYHLAVYDLEDGLFLAGRAKGYMALGTLGSLEAPAALEKDCDFLIARCLSEKGLTFFNVDAPFVWHLPPPADPFAGLDATQLRKLLKDGSDRLARGALSPLVWKVETAQPSRHWVVSCAQSPLEEMLHRFASEAAIEVTWESVPPSVRRRPATLFLGGVSTQRIVEVACGVAALTARFTGESVIVRDPQECESMILQRELIVDEAISTWRRFFLRWPGDSRIPQGHFAVARLYEHAEETVSALGEYHMVSRRFLSDPVVPRALLRSARLRMALRDYQGAKENLTELLDRHPNADHADEIYYRLAKAAMEQGLLDEALKVFKKLYFLNLSGWSRRAAGVGMGQCLYRRERYGEAAECLHRCLPQLQDTQDQKLPLAALLLGRSAAAVGDYDKAADALRVGLSADPDRPMRIDLFLELASADIHRGDLSEAVGALNKIDEKILTEAQKYRWLILHSLVYRRMGLPRTAIGLLRSRIQTIIDEQIRCAIALELAKCYLDADDPDSAHALLVGVLPKMEPSRELYEGSCKLAEICLRTDRHEQAVTILSEVLNGPCPEDIRRRAGEMLVAAHLFRKEYQQAVAAYAEIAAADGEGQVQP